MNDAWTMFWQEPGQSQCLLGSVDIQDMLSRHWAAFAVTLGPSARVIDLGCGAGAITRTLTLSRRDIHVTGVDFARIPFGFHPQFDLLSNTDMEALPFPEASFAAAVSQFGYEYSRVEETARELARVLAPYARFSLVVHHSDSSILAASRHRWSGLEALDAIAPTFLAGEAAPLRTMLAGLTRRFPDDKLMAEIAHVLPLRVGRPPRERCAIWEAIADAIEPERCLSHALQIAAVSPAMLEPWLAPLRAIADSLAVTALRDPSGGPLAWVIEGVRGSRA